MTQAATPRWAGGFRFLWLCEDHRWLVLPVYQSGEHASREIESNRYFQIVGRHDAELSNRLDVPVRMLLRMRFEQVTQPGVMPSNMDDDWRL